MGGKDPLKGIKKSVSQVSNGVNNTLSQTGNAINQGLGSAANSTNEFLARSTGVQGIKSGGSSSPLADASAGLVQGQVNEQNVASIRESQKRLIDDYAKSSGKYKTGFLDIAQKDARKQLAETMEVNKRKTRSQGFINYGARDLDNAMAQAETRSDLAQKEYDINKNIDDQIAEMRQSYTQSGLDYANLGQAQQIDAYKSALENMQRQSAATRDLLSSGGQLAGSIAAQDDKKAKSKTGHFNA